MRVVRAVVGAVGELAITAGVVLLLFVAWELGVVAITTNRAQAATVDSLERQFAQATPSTSATTHTPTDPVAPTTPVAVPTPPPGDAFAILRIPRLGSAWAKPVYQGVGLDVLAKGIGHYPDTQLPGQVGNAAFAGHRAGHGNPLIDIDTIRPGDAIVVETADSYVVYRADRSEIVPPTDIKVLAPVPAQPGVAPTESWLTLTSCEPKYGSTNRFIVFAKLDRSVPRAQGLPADVLAAAGGNG